ncbi:GMC family oxidoreductase [Pseudoruegeria sp. HB172150]|uniref:GMC family oxidoreductase n=1 Tax=Pseudoruegeria sp. HB172150 TaxID=2721164 RepID=UPI001553BAE2|nr:GMC family oxidoreductase [Pseudoruegeria sp. HB172150]
MDDLLRQICDAIAPDPDGGAIAAGALPYVENCLAEDDGTVRNGIERLRGIADGDLRGHLHEVEDEPWFRQLSEWVAEGIYADPGNGGNRDGRGWAWIGFSDPRGTVEAPRTTPPPAPALTRDRQFVDVIVVGAGAGGTVCAAELALNGKQVLLIERGDWLTPQDDPRDHLRNHRNPRYGHNTGPDDSDGARVLIGPDGAAREFAPHEPGYSNNAACVGGGTFVYGAQAWRFHPDDFRMASRYGTPEGSSLADWPFGYEEMERWYARAEAEIGVAGPSGRLPHEPFRSADLPMPPVPQYESARVLSEGARRLGIGTFVPPLAVNTVPRQDRPACIECATCVGFPCPVDAKNGTQNTVLPRALATGNLTLATRTVVQRLQTDSAGTVTGVSVVREGLNGPEELTINAETVVLAAGAIETARLLLLSASGREPEGLGNGAGLVGRNLQGHTYPTVYGRFDTQAHPDRGPGVSIATTEWTHGNPGVIGGAMMADDFIMVPAQFWRQALPPRLKHWGAEPHAFMHDNYRRVTQVKGPVQEIPSPACRVELDPNVRDKWGRPVARLSGVVHPETTRTAAYLLDRARDWLLASDARETWGEVPKPKLSAYQHQAGTCRIGKSPETSVCTPEGRVWGHENLWIADASLHPTNGAFNPVLTIMAMGFRTASLIAPRLSQV